MGHYNLRDLINRWERGDLSLEQAIGQILLLLLAFNDRLNKLEATPKKSKSN